MNVDLAQVLVSRSVTLVVGSVGAWVAGTFGVRQGLRRTKREKAFDRSLEWYEKTVRSLDRFADSASKMPIFTIGDSESDNMLR